LSVNATFTREESLALSNETVAAWTPLPCSSFIIPETLDVVCAIAEKLARAKRRNKVNTRLIIVGLVMSIIKVDNLTAWVDGNMTDGY